MERRQDVRNIAIIAHVDHGKTTLVDEMLKQSGTFRKNEKVNERVMDSNDLERERGITILSKTTSVKYKETKINIVDTPGHADFGGEVERILMMVDSVLLLVDAFEGCMPQTRFVLKKALGLKKHAIVVINKIDRPEARPQVVIDQVLDLFIELGADDDQLDFPVIYASARDGYATCDLERKTENMKELFELIVKHVPAPYGYMKRPFQVLFSNIDYDDYIGRIGIGRVERGVLKSGQQAVLCKRDNTEMKVKVSKLYQFEGLKRVEVQEAKLGDIIAVSGISDLHIGETLCDPECIEMLPFVVIDEPCISMNFIVNNSPFAGKEGTYVTSRNLRDRLFKEVQTNVGMKIEETETPDAFKVSGRGELHLSILIETMRREGYEFQVSRPKVIYKIKDNKRLEPINLLIIDVREEYLGVVMEKLGNRKSDLINMTSDNGGSVNLEFKVPARGLIGYRSEFLTDTKGTGVMNHIFHNYEEYKGDIRERTRGSIIAFEAGESTNYGLYNAQDRGRLFIPAGIKVYEGMVVGESAKNEDLVINVCKKKHITNVRASGTDDALKLITPVNLSLEGSLEFIAEDELVEVTPKNIRLRKRELGKINRAKSAKSNSNN